MERIRSRSSGQETVGARAIQIGPPFSSAQGCSSVPARSTRANDPRTSSSRYPMAMTVSSANSSGSQNYGVLILGTLGDDIDGLV